MRSPDAREARRRLCRAALTYSNVYAQGITGRRLKEYRLRLYVAARRMVAAEKADLVLRKCIVCGDDVWWDNTPRPRHDECVKTKKRRRP